MTGLEDRIKEQSSALETRMRQISLVDQFPERPAYATRGRAVTLWANYFKLQPSSNLLLHRYHVNVKPEAKGRKLKRIFELLLEDPVMAGTATDFKQYLIMRNKIDDSKIELHYRAELEDDPQPNTTPYTVTIQHTGELDVAALLRQLQTAQRSNSMAQEMQMQVVQTLNILLGHYPQANSVTSTIAGNKHFLFRGQTANSNHGDLGGGLHALRGFFRSVRCATGRILVNININHAVFFKPGNLVDLINGFADSYGRNPRELERFLKKVRVETTHLQAKKNRRGERIPRVKTIFAVATPNDGQRLPHPPRVAKYAAGAKDVHFWLDNTPVASSSKPAPRNPSKPAAKPLPSGYISVFDFLQKRRSLPTLFGIRLTIFRT